jgi:hypothetical protein
MSTKEIEQDFPDGQEINQVISGKKPMPSDAALRMVYEVQIERQEERKERKQEANATKNTNASDAAHNSAMSSGAANSGNQGMGNSAMSGMNSNSGNDKESTDQTTKATSEADITPAKLTPEEEAEQKRREDQLYTDLEVQQLPSLPPDQRFKKILSMSADAHYSLADSLRGNKGQEFLEGLNPKQKETLQALNNPGGVVVGELSQAKLLRAIYSERQLE